MDPVIIRLGIIDNAAEIVALAETYADHFTRYPTIQRCARRDPRRSSFDPYRATDYEDDDRYEVLQVQDMPLDLRELILMAFLRHGRPPRPYYVQLNRYRKGDYVLPHRDAMRQGLYVLTSSECDGLTVQDGPIFRRIVDRAGTFILAGVDAWHWVDPVLEPVRVTLLSIPPLMGFGEDAAR